MDHISQIIKDHPPICLMPKQNPTTALNSTESQREDSKGSSLILSCEKCGGAGWFGYDVGPCHADFGKCYPCECTLRASRDKRAEWVREVCGLPSGLHDRQLSNFDPKRVKGGGQAIKAITRFVIEGGWLLIGGDYQKGKTHLAAAAANALLEQQEHVVFSYTKTLLDRLRQLISQPEGYVPFLDATKECPYLILDDFGVEKRSEWVTEQLEDIFNWRADHNLPLLVTTNLSDDEIADFSPRISARLRRLATKVVLA